ncbi:MAG: carboxypeptidase-like regulatory domain-containing protein, partial [Bacteroidales bacterium]
FCALLFIPLCANAQKVNLKGRIVDNTQTSIDGACVSLVDKDSNIVSSIVSNSDGQFSFSYSSEGNYSLNVSHIGYMPLAIKLIALTGNNDVG